MINYIYSLKNINFNFKLYIGITQYRYFVKVRREKNCYNILKLLRFETFQIHK